MIKIVANIVPILNDRDPSGNIIYRGPQTTKIHRYLLVVFEILTIWYFGQVTDSQSGNGTYAWA